MKGYLLDTNIVSELRKRRCNPNVKHWTDQRSVEELHLSTITLAEIRFGIEQQADAQFRQELEEWLERKLRPWFGRRILEVDENVILRWRRMVADGKSRGVTFSQPDLFIAATADLHDLCVVTRNIRDFNDTGIRLANPWIAG